MRFNTMPVKNPIILGLAILLLSSTCNAAKDVEHITGDAVAMETLQYIESLRDKDGSYYYLKTCTKKKCHTLPTKVQQSNSWVGFAYLSAYKLTDQRKYLRKTREEMEEFMKRCPIGKGGTFECLFNSVQLAHAYEHTKDKRYLQYLKLNGTRPFHYSVRTMTLGIMAREMALAARFGLYDDVVGLFTDTQIIDQRVEKSNVVIRTEDGKPLRRTKCYNELAKLEIAASLSEMPSDTLLPGSEQVDASAVRGILIEQSTQYFDDMDFSKLAENPKIYIIQLVDLEPCAESLIMLHKVTGEEKYLEDALAILQHMIDHRWDSKRSPKFNGDGGFILQGCRPDEGRKQVCYSLNKALNDNAYAVYLFSLVPDTRFSVRKDYEIRHFDYAIEDPGYKAFWSGKTTTSTTVLKETTVPKPTPEETPPVEVRGFPYETGVLVLVVVLMCVISIYLIRKKGGVREG